MKKVELRTQDGKTIEIWRWGDNDYSVEFIDDDCSVRGTLLEVMQELDDAYDLATLQEVK